MASILGALFPVGEYLSRGEIERRRQLAADQLVKGHRKATERREWQEAAKTGVASYDRAKASE